MIIRRVFLASLAFGLVGCRIDVTDPGRVSGTYTLRTLQIGGGASPRAELPAVFFEIGTSFLVEVTAGSITLNEDLTCSLSITLRETDGGTVTTSQRTGVGTYTLAGPLAHSEDLLITLTLPDADLPPTFDGLTNVNGSSIFLRANNSGMIWSPLVPEGYNPSFTFRK